MVESRIKKANKILRIITLSLIGVVVLFAMVIGGLCLSGYKVLWVLGDSSIQSIDPYSLILVKPCTVEELVAKDARNGVSMGDFAVRYSGGGYVTHEVVLKEQDETTGVWYFDTMQVGDRTTETDGEKAGGILFSQKDLAGKVVGKESFIGKLLAFVQGYPSIETTLGASNPNKTLALFRILTVAIILIGIGKFADFMHYKETLY